MLRTRRNTTVSKTHIFVYGTLKEGFANFAINQGRRLPGEYETILRFPLYVVHQNHIPWLVDESGVGHHVIGQVFEVDADALSRMDQLEKIDEPGWYSRKTIRVCRCHTSPQEELEVQVYFGSRSRLKIDVVHTGPIKEFTQAQDRMYRR